MLRVKKKKKSKKKKKFKIFFFFALRFPVDFYPVLFAIPRIVGWLSNYIESIRDKETKIVRPRQKYIGSPLRHFVPIEERDFAQVRSTSAYSSASGRRRNASKIIN